MDPTSGRSEMGDKPVDPEDLLWAMMGYGYKNPEYLRSMIKMKSRLPAGVVAEDAERTRRWMPPIHVLLCALAEQNIADSDRVDNELVLLGSHAFVTALFANWQFEDFKDILRACWSLEEPLLSVLREDIEVSDREWFKLIIAHGYLNVNIMTIYTSEIMILPFEVIRKNCLGYTKYSYIAYKTLHLWIEKCARTNFWHGNDATRTQNQLEAIIFSNWDSCIRQIAGINSTDIFPVYLRIMTEKYEGFSDVIFDKCVQNLSWQNVKKYTMLAPICKFVKDIKKIVSSDLPACIFTSLTKNHLKHAGTKLYLTILKMLKGNEWQSVFGESFLRVSAKWEDEQNSAAIQFLWQQWMKPTMQKFPPVFQYLWKNDSMKRLPVGRTYLERIGDRLGFELIYDGASIGDVLNRRVEDFSEAVRLNAFAIVCQNKNWNYSASEDEPFAVVAKRFLYFNCDTSSVTMRKEIIKNFEILIGNLQKFVVKRRAAGNFDFVDWLYAFLLDCLDIGSSYQRTILALSLFNVLLHMAEVAKQSCTCVGGKWEFVNKRSFTVLIRLVLHEMTDVREKSADILTKYFENLTLTTKDCRLLGSIATKRCDSSKFYEAAGGCTIRRVLIPLHTKEPLRKEQLEFFAVTVMIEMNHQLTELLCTGDILNCAVNDSPFFGSMMTLLEFFSLDASLVVPFTPMMFYRVEEATEFFLSALSSKAAQLECLLSSSHQLVVSCIWISLKVCCEAAALFGSSFPGRRTDLTRGVVKRAADVIVSVLLKCRHKGAIEAAGLALAKLTRAVSRTCDNDVIKTHLSNLLKVDDKDNINLTRSGAGLSIMFHRIVSSDARIDRPMLHSAVITLLNSLKTPTEVRSNQQGEECVTDSWRARHLHFLRSAVADKSLQAQLVPYMEDICLTCFEYLRSPEWIVRNASLQLFGAVVPRLVGQCSARELDYGTGNSVDHFVTHFPLLAESVLTQLESLSSPTDSKKNHPFDNLQNVSNVVSILTLLSKMSTGGFELVDYSSKPYISRAKRVFVVLFGHPVFHVRLLASKAYAAFVPLPEIPRVLATMRLEIVDTKSNNHQHALLCSQIYLGRKLKHELQCTSDKFFIDKHKFDEVELKKDLEVQMQRLNLNLTYRLDSNEQDFSYDIDSTTVNDFTGTETQAGVTEFVKKSENFFEPIIGDKSDEKSAAFQVEERKNYSAKLDDDDSLLSRMREVSERLHDDDFDVRKSVADSIGRLVEDSISGSDRRFIFDPRSELSKLWVEVIIAMLTDADPEVRESMAKTLHPLTRRIVGESDRSLCARAVCHKIFATLSLMSIDDPSIKDAVLEIFRRLTDSIKINKPTDGIESPFNNDELFNRDYASFIDILFYWVRTLVQGSSTTSVETRPIDGIIYGNAIESKALGVDWTNLRIILKLSTSDYLARKKQSLMRTIDEHRSVLVSLRRESRCTDY